MAYYPGQKVTHRRPRRITLAKILIYTTLAALVYLGVAFVPPYWRYYQAGSVLDDETNKAYSKRHQKDGWNKIEMEIHRRVRDRLLDVLKVESEDLKVKVKKRPESIIIRAEWTAYARYPLIGKRSPLEFTEEIRADLR